MKYFSALILCLAFLNSCKKDEKIVEKKVTIDSIQNNSNKDSIVSNDSDLKIEPLNIAPEKGKTVFEKDGKFLFYFDTRSNLGEIKVNGTVYKLDLLNSVDNEYYISGDNIKISATDGIFKEMTGDCLYGDFPKMKVDIGGKVIEINNVSVQDCPAY